MDGPAPTGNDVEAYAQAVFRHVLRRLGRRPDVSPFDADDIAMEAVERFLVDATTVMARYPEPHIYAAACVTSRTEDWRRKERAQRSEGARLVAGADGAPAIARPVATLSALLPGQAPAAAGGYDTVELLADLRSALAGLDRTDRELVVHVDFLGYSVTDAALLIGVSRCQASRRHTRALAQLAASLQEPLAC
jgi:RNA polymerase sigma factor (sigma-70 family)